MPGGERAGRWRRVEVLPPYDAIVLTGGRARRLGGAYKPGIVVGGRSLAERVAGAVADAAQVVVVGPPAPGLVADVVTTESPVGGGPAAALEAGLAYVTAPVVAALAGDLPFLTGTVVDELRLALGADPAAAAAVLVDDTGRDQPLCAVWRTELLRDALATVGDPTDGAAELARPDLAGPLEAGSGQPRAVPDMLAGGHAGRSREPSELAATTTLRLYGVALRDLLAAAEPLARRTVVVDGGPPPWFDCDTEDDVARAREWT
jgi:molybdenum cofactor guanylyltransferase